jgi:hypothetical protein
MTEELTIPSCREVTELLSMFLDRDLSLNDAARVKEHILICPWCFNYERQLNLLRDFCGKHEKELFREEPLPDEARDRIKAILINHERP